MKTENAFKKIAKADKEVPSELKKKVMNDIAKAKVILELSELFGENLPATFGELFKSK
jgi:predicted transcriptional regulator